MVGYFVSCCSFVWRLFDLVYGSSVTRDDKKGVGRIFFMFLGGIFGTSGMLGCLTYINREQLSFLITLSLNISLCVTLELRNTSIGLDESKTLNFLLCNSFSFRNEL